MLQVASMALKTKNKQTKKQEQDREAGHEHRKCLMVFFPNAVCLSFWSFCLFRNPHQWPKQTEPSDTLTPRPAPPAIVLWPGLEMPYLSVYGIRVFICYHVSLIMVRETDGWALMLASSRAPEFLWRAFSFSTVVLRGAQLCCLNSILSAAIIPQEGFVGFSPTTPWWHQAPPSCALISLGGNTHWVLHLIRGIRRGWVSEMPKHLIHFKFFFMWVS